MYEVKMFEFTSKGKNKIFHKPEQQKYFNSNNYKWNKEIAKTFISFIHDVRSDFNNQNIYGQGIKQLCCHLLGIINEITIKTGKLVGKKIELYSLCYDNPFMKEFKVDIKCYKKALMQFKCLVDNFLKENNLDDRVKYCGFLAASGFINNIAEMLGSKNYGYVMNRYYNYFQQNERSLNLMNKNLPGNLF